MYDQIESNVDLSPNQANGFAGGPDAGIGAVLLCSPTGREDPFVGRLHDHWRGGIEVCPDVYKLLACVLEKSRQVAGIVVNVAFVDGYDWQIFDVFTEKLGELGLKIVFYRWPGRLETKLVLGRGLDMAAGVEQFGQWVDKLESQRAVEEQSGGVEHADRTGSKTGKVWPATPPQRTDTTVRPGGIDASTVRAHYSQEDADNGEQRRDSSGIASRDDPAEKDGDHLDGRAAAILTSEELHALLGDQAGGDLKDDLPEEGKP